MSLTTEMQQKIYDDLNTQYEQVGYFQDQVVIVDNEKRSWDTAIEALDGNLLGQIQVVNRAIDDVKDAYNVRFTGINSCRSDLFWMMTGINSSPTPKLLTFKAVALNENGYTADVEAGGGNVLGSGVTFFHYLDPATGILTTSPTNAVTGAEQGVSPYPPYYTHDADTFRFGFAPKNYYGIKYYSEHYALDIGDTFVTSFIGTMSLGSNQLTVMSPIGSTGEDSEVNQVLKIGQIVTCEEPGVLVTTTKIAGITTGFADLSQIPTTGIGTTTVSPVNVITLNTPSGIGVSAFDSVSFTVIDDADTGPVGQVGVVTSNGAVYKPNRENNRDDPYVAVPSSSDQGGIGALFNVGISSTGTIQRVSVDVVGQGGLGYSPGDTVKIAGDELGATTPADDIEFTVQTMPQGRFQYQIKMGDNVNLWLDPFVPQTVGIMQTANIGMGVSIALDNSGRPKGSQGWNPSLNGKKIPMDLNNLRVLTKVEPPNVGADKSYWKVGFQTAPIFQSNRVSAGDPTGSIASNALGALLETLDACDSTVDNPINNAISALTPIETAFTDHTGNNKLMVDAANSLRSERNEVCLRIWGLRQSIGNINDRITKLEGVRSFIDDTNVQKVVG
jgi:hypothetical protein